MEAITMANTISRRIKNPLRLLAALGLLGLQTQVSTLSADIRPKATFRLQYGVHAAGVPGRYCRFEKSSGTISDGRTRQMDMGTGAD
jgi:hypothetical protein